MSCAKMSCPECISQPFPPFGGQSMAERPSEVEIENGHIASEVVKHKHVAIIWSSVNRTVVIPSFEFDSSFVIRISSFPIPLLIRKTRNERRRHNHRHDLPRRIILLQKYPKPPQIPPEKHPHLVP